jgi:nitric oxide reductase activation protein
MQKKQQRNFTHMVSCLVVFKLDPSADHYVKRIFGQNHFNVIDNVQRLPEKLSAIFASLTN